MNKLIIMLMILVSSFFHACHSDDAFNVEDEMMGGKKELTSSPTKTFWMSLETTSRAAIKKSEDLIAIYYSLFYIPRNNEVNIKIMGGMPSKEIHINPAKLPTKIETLSEFKGVNIYKLFFINDRTDKLNKIIDKKRKKNKIKKASLEFKVTEDPEKMIHKNMTNYIKNQLLKKAEKKYINQDFSIVGNFLILKIYDFKYKNNDKMINFKFEYIFTSLDKRDIDYAANLDSVEEQIATNMDEGNYKKAQELNDIYKTIVPDKVRYYNNAYTINMKLDDKMGALLILVEEIEVTEDTDTHKDAITKIIGIYKKSLKRKALRKVNRLLSKNYKKYVKGKLKKDKFVDFLKNLVIEFSLD